MTTITVAVPAPLSPNDPAFLAAAAAANQSTPPPPTSGGSLPPSVASLPPPPTTIALPTVPAPQEATFKWKYEQNKDKASSSGNNHSSSSTVSSAVAGSGNSSLVSQFIHSSVERDPRGDCDKKEGRKRKNLLTPSSRSSLSLFLSSAAVEESSLARVQTASELPSW